MDRSTARTAKALIEEIDRLEAIVNGMAAHASPTATLKFDTMGYVVTMTREDVSAVISTYKDLLGKKISELTRLSSTLPVAPIVATLPDSTPVKITYGEGTNIGDPPPEHMAYPKEGWEIEAVQDNTAQWPTFEEAAESMKHLVPHNVMSSNSAAAPNDMNKACNNVRPDASVQINLRVPTVDERILANQIADGVMHQNKEKAHRRGGYER